MGLFRQHKKRWTVNILLAKDGTQIEYNGSPLVIKYVHLSQAKLWDRNPHDGDVGQMIQSIQLHGFRDPPEYDSALDGFPSGNHRTIALRAMEKSGDYSVPKHIGIDRITSEWCMPVIFGADAGSREAAEAYGIDANNLVMAGGNFEPTDIARLWKPGKYEAILTELAARSIGVASVDGDHLDALLRLSASRSKAEPTTAAGEPPTLKLKTPDIDDLEALRQQYGVIEGQRWQLGKNEIQTVSAQDQLRQLVEDESVTLIVTPLETVRMLHYWELTTGKMVELLTGGITTRNGTQKESPYEREISR